MKKYIFIGMGGFIGALIRLAVKQMDLTTNFAAFPINTLSVNLLGCLLIGAFFTFHNEVKVVKEHLRLGIAAGFLGALTTFSTVCKEVVQMYENGHWQLAGIYIVLSISLGILFVYIGSLIVKLLNRRRFIPTDADDLR